MSTLNISLKNYGQQGRGILWRPPSRTACYYYYYYTNFKMYVSQWANHRCSKLISIYRDLILDFDKKYILWNASICPIAEI